MAIQFTEAEWLIMSSLAYVIPDSKFDKDGHPLPNQTIDVSSLLDGMEKQALSGGIDNENFNSAEDKENYSRTITVLKDKLKDGNFVVSKCINHNGSNESGLVVFSIEPFNNVDNDVIVCCRGSDGFSVEHLNDWVGADAALAWKTQTQQQQELDAFMNGFEKYDNIYLTGHSLGGNLAMYGAVSFSERDPSFTDKIANVYSFDGPGFNPEFVSQHIAVIHKLNSCIYNFQNEHDLVSSSLISIGTVSIIKSSINNANVLVNHNRWAFTISADGTLRRNDSGEKDAICNIWNKTTRKFSALFNTLNYWKILQKGICRDFSKATMERMLNAAKETEQEAWWRIDRWDCWYRLQKRLGFLKWDMYAGNIDSYYRKLIDINDASVKDIQKIFYDVYSLNSEYSQKITESNEKCINIVKSLEQVSSSIVAGK